MPEPTRANRRPGARAPAHDDTSLEMRLDHIERLLTEIVGGEFPGALDRLSARVDGIDHKVAALPDIVAGVMVEDRGKRAIRREESAGRAFAYIAGIVLSNVLAGVITWLLTHPHGH